MLVVSLERQRLCEPTKRVATVRQFILQASAKVQRIRARSEQDTLTSARLI
jgi:hypothetical protein